MRSAKITFDSPNNPIIVAEAPENAGEYSFGLQGYDSLADGRGMLFVLPQPRVVGRFWMASVSFPLDMIFIDSQGVIVHIEHSVQPMCKEIFSYLCAAVLEVPGGWCARNGVVEGARCAVEDVP